MVTSPTIFGSPSSLKMVHSDVEVGVVVDAAVVVSPYTEGLVRERPGWVLASDDGLLQASCPFSLGHLHPCSIDLELQVQSRQM